MRLSLYIKYLPTLVEWYLLYKTKRVLRSVIRALHYVFVPCKERFFVTIYKYFIEGYPKDCIYAICPRERVLLRMKKLDYMTTFSSATYIKTFVFIKTGYMGAKKIYQCTAKEYLTIYKGVSCD